MSPFLSPELLLRTARFGHVLDDLVEDGCKILLLTRPPKGLTDLEWFADLESLGDRRIFPSSLACQNILVLRRPRPTALRQGLFRLGGFGIGQPDASWYPI